MVGDGWPAYTLAFPVHFLPSLFDLKYLIIYPLIIYFTVMTLNFKNYFGLAFATSCLFTLASCDNDENFATPNEVVPPTETIYPVDFRFLTLNHEGNYGEKPSVSYIGKNGEVYSDYLMQVNNFQIKDNPHNVLQVENDLYIVHGSFWSDNGLVQVNANSFELKRHINLKGKLRSYNAVQLEDNKVFVAGDELDYTYNAVVGDLNAETDEEFVLEDMSTGIVVNAMRRVGDNIFMASASASSPLLMMNVNNISAEGIQTLAENFQLTNRANRFVKDKNNNLWVAIKQSQRVKLIAINGETGAIVHEVPMPYSVSTLLETMYDISNDGATLYARSHKAIFKINVDSPQELDEADYEYRDHVGLLKDLKVTEDGTLIFINQRQESFMPSEVVELTITDDANWGINKYDVGYQGVILFVPNYAKAY